MKYFLYFFVVLFLFNLNSHAEFVCASTTTRANIAADEDDSCTTDAEVLTVTLTKGEFYNVAGSDTKYGNTASATWVLKTGNQSGDIGGGSSINYLPNINKGMIKPGTYTHFRGYMLPTISIKGGITTADGYSCVTAGATSNVFAMASSDIDTLSNKTTVDIIMNNLLGSGSFDSNCGDDSPSAGNPCSSLYKVTEGGSVYDVELLASDGTRATSAAAVAEIRAIITLSSPIVVTENSIVEVEMFFKGTNAIAIEWSDASSGCDNISSVAPYFSVNVTVTEQ